MRRKKRVTGRFYIFLLILLVIAFLIVRPHLNFGSREAIIIAEGIQSTGMGETVTTAQAAFAKAAE